MLSLSLPLLPVVVAAASTTLEIPTAAMAATGLTAIAFIAWLIRQNSAITNYIRASAGVKPDPAERRIVDQPITIAEERRLATHEELETVRNRVAEIDRELKSIRHEIQVGNAALQTEASKRAASIHSRVDNLCVTVAKIEERSEIQAAQSAQINQKIDRLIERIK